MLTSVSRQLINYLYVTMLLYFLFITKFPSFVTDNLFKMFTDSIREQNVNLVIKKFYIIIFFNICIMLMLLINKVRFQMLHIICDNFKVPFYFYLNFFNFVDMIYVFGILRDHYFWCLQSQPARISCRLYSYSPIVNDWLHLMSLFSQ